MNYEKLIIILKNQKNDIQDILIGYNRLITLLENEKNEQNIIDFDNSKALLYSLYECNQFIFNISEILDRIEYNSYSMIGDIDEKIQEMRDYYKQKKIVMEKLGPIVAYLCAITSKNDNNDDNNNNGNDKI